MVYFQELNNQKKIKTLIKKMTRGSPKRGSPKKSLGKRAGRNALPYYATINTPPTPINANLPWFWGYMDDESTMAKIAILILMMFFSMYFFVMSCIGLSESKYNQQLDKAEWKAFFSFVLIVTFLMMVGVVLVFYNYN